MFDGTVAAAYRENQRQWERADPRRNGHRRVILAVTYARYKGGEVRVECPACLRPTAVGIYPQRLSETLHHIDNPHWVCEACERENGEVLLAFDRADGYALPTPSDFEDDLPF
jgi:hypothetical protein